MRQVMLNLLLNAADAAGAAGAAGGKGHVHARLQADADVVCFTVANTGERFTREQLEQSIAAEGGNDPRGFGLWVCREIAVQYGGGFDVLEPDDSTAPGTRLVFWMPNRERHEEPAAH